MTRLSQRVKPELPYNLEKFRVLFIKLGIPMGPPYVGNYEFEVDSLSKEHIEFIKEMQGDANVVDITKSLIETEDIFVRAEAVAQHFNHNPGVDFWKVERSDYLISFEKNNVAKKRGKHNIAQEFYKPFVCFLIEAGYEFFQVAEILGRAPNTIRMWANRYGYKEFSRIVTKTSDHTGKNSRVLKNGDVAKVEQGTFQFGNNFSDQNVLSQSRELKDEDNTFISNDTGGGKLFEKPKVSNEEPGDARSHITHIMSHDEEMILLFEEGCEEIPQFIKETLNKRITWKQVLKRVLNPSQQYVICDKDKAYYFVQKTADPHNGIVVLSFERVITFTVGIALASEQLN